MSARIAPSSVIAARALPALVPGSPAADAVRRGPELAEDDAALGPPLPIAVRTVPGGDHADRCRESRAEQAGLCGAWTGRRRLRFDRELVGRGMRRS
ncbi:hypothetical protein C5E45_31870 [Nocardia nova]|uniref:Uncharacterized protein n=1 Tax=Nocardia nova TaxID=37330 RepID=A0A2S6AG74_9NOCA|nr:hypothetical protein C5E41_26350 [Nocardia nova]PPJ33422.1 hypothetical protein C5E45_31870 [Nocardia nova]